MCPRRVVALPAPREPASSRERPAGAAGGYGGCETHPLEGVGRRLENSKQASYIKEIVGDRVSGAGTVGKECWKVPLEGHGLGWENQAEIKFRHQHAFSNRSFTGFRKKNSTRWEFLN
jgi:hypothetical protein